MPVTAVVRTVRVLMLPRLIGSRQSAVELVETIRHPAAGQTLWVDGISNESIAQGAVDELVRLAVVAGFGRVTLGNVSDRATNHFVRATNHHDITLDTAVRE